MAAQDHSLYTRDYQSRIIANDDDPKGRMCDQYDETVDHLVSGCPGIRPTKYKKKTWQSLSIYPLEDLPTLQSHMS